MRVNDLFASMSVTSLSSHTFIKNPLIFIHAGHRQRAQLELLAAQTAVNVIHPQVYPSLLAQISHHSLITLCFPLGFQSRYHPGRKSFGFLPQQHSKHLAHLVVADAFQIRPRQERLQRARHSHIRRDQPRAKRHRRFAGRAHLGNLHRHCTNARLNLALRLVTALNCPPHDRFRCAERLLDTERWLGLRHCRSAKAVSNSFPYCHYSTVPVVDSTIFSR